MAELVVAKNRNRAMITLRGGNSSRMHSNEIRTPLADWRRKPFYRPAVKPLIGVYRAINRPLRLWHALRMIRASRQGDVIILGLFLRNVPKIPAIFSVEPGRMRYINLNFLRADRGSSQAGFESAMRQIKAALAGKTYKTFVWGSYDKRFLQCDIATFLSNVNRIENGIFLSDRRAGSYRLSFLVDGPAGYFSGLEATRLETDLEALTPGALRAHPANQTLLAQVLSGRLSKYTYRKPLDNKPTATDILVAGQMALDAALLETNCLGKSMLELIGLVHQRLLPHHPGARVFFKPHPHSKTAAREISEIAAQWPKVEFIAADTSIIDCLDNKPVVATYTSTAGLEAALRGSEVHCFGNAFYAGWGFTVDHVAAPRRTNRLQPDDVYLHIVSQRMIFVNAAGSAIIPAEQALAEHDAAQSR
jgi:capsular polysaccharide export protein